MGSDGITRWRPLTKQEHEKFQGPYDDSDPEAYEPQHPYVHHKDNLQDYHIYTDPKKNPDYSEKYEFMEPEQREGLDEQYTPNPNYVDPASIDNLMRQGSRNAISRKR